jgi:preprotein translocase subunit SecA
MLKNFVKIFGGDPNKKTVEQFRAIAQQINAFEPQFEALGDDALRAKTGEFRARIAESVGNMEGLEEKEQFKAYQDALEEILPEAFAAVREASKRTIGLRHFDVQMIGGIALHRGSIAEMRTGEGKTLVATLPVYLNALVSRGIHLVTVNDYLARRDARWMAPIYHLLGLTVGVLQMAAATENGKKAFLVDFERESPHEDQRHLRMVDRRLAYEADVTYGTNAEFGFDYLRDNMTMRLSDRVQRRHHYAIVDEVDNVLIDEARTPLIISGPASGDLEWYTKMAQVVKQLRPEDYELNEKDRNVSITEVGLARVEQLLGQPLMDPDRPEDVTPQQARLRGHLEQALRAQFVFQRNKDYLVQGGKVVIVDEFTGRLMPGRRWSDGLHQAVEAKEGARIEPENVTYATITLQNYFRMYKKLAGMTGTALTEAEEFSKIYNLEVVPIPANLEYRALGNEATLNEIKAKDGEGYPYTYFAKRDDKGQTPVYYRRKDYPDVIYKTVEAKMRSIVMDIVREHVRGRPLLVGTTSVESSELLSNRLKAEPVRRLLQIALVRRVWMEANKREEDGRLIPELQPFNEPLEKVTPDSLRKFIHPYGLTNINPEDLSNLHVVLELLRLDDSDTDRLKKVLQGGVPHQVLNARKHTEESQIIAGAGGFGAVTIATNMAGRGVDIKLGGELDEAMISEFKNLLRRSGVANPYGLSNSEILFHLLRINLGSDVVTDMNLPETNKQLYFEQIRNQLLLNHGGRPGQEEWQRLADILYNKIGIGLKSSERMMNFWHHTEQELRVRDLEGLMVIGSERHEARRIDNQLRGRAARQGDPGASRFYLSLQDDLMRLQGGSQVSGLMERLRVDDSLPLEVRLVGNIIEQSQHRIEGANFDVRKHLIEYDDVLNKQRAQIYGQRDRIFVKEDLSDNIAEMLEQEVTERVETGLADEEGPWKLIAWLEQVQPSFMSGERLFPSFGYSLLLKELNQSSDLGQSTLDLMTRAIDAENAHHSNAIKSLIETTGQGLEAQISGREDTLDAYFEGLREMEDTERPRSQKMLEELNGLLGMQLRLNNEQLRAFGEDPESIKEDIQSLISNNLTLLYASRVISAVSNRFGEALAEKFEFSDWSDAVEKITEAAEDALARRRNRLVGESGQIRHDIENLMPREINDTTKLKLLLSLAQGARMDFDQKTHKQVKRVFSRLSYIFLMAQLLEGQPADQVTENVLTHLDEAEESLRFAWGEREYARLSANAQRLADFGLAAKQAFGEERLNEPVSDLGESDREALIESVGRYALNEAHRQLMLSATTELWVDYLTRIEALRVSIGLEAYAQRDPLVQYKGKASEMFAQLVEDIRGLVISRVFAYQPRPIEITPVEVSNAPTPARQTAPTQTDQSKKKKRRRH